MALYKVQIIRIGPNLEKLKTFNCPQFCQLLPTFHYGYSEITVPLMRLTRKGKYWNLVLWPHRSECRCLRDNATIVYEASKIASSSLSCNCSWFRAEKFGIECNGCNSCSGLWLTVLRWVHSWSVSLNRDLSVWNPMVGPVLCKCLFKCFESDLHSSVKFQYFTLSGKAHEGTVIFRVSINEMSVEVGKTENNWMSLTFRGLGQSWIIWTCTVPW